MPTQTKQVTLNVLLQEGDFTIECFDTLDVRAGENIGFTISITKLLGFDAPVQFSISGGPIGMTVDWPVGDILNPADTNIQCNLFIPLDNGLVGQYTLDLTGISV